MKKLHWMAAAAMTIAEILLFGCGMQPLENRTRDIEGTELLETEKIEGTGLLETEKIEGTELVETEDFEPKRMVMLDGKLYIETGETDSMPRCGTMDGAITSTTNGEKPEKDGQSNFGKDIGYQYGMRENRIEIPLDDKWCIFAYNENNLDHVSITIKDVKQTGATVTVNNASDTEITFGDDFSLERYNSETGEWNYVPIAAEGEWGFHSVGYPVNSGDKRDWEVDWTWLYGEIGPGEYRIIKTVLSEKKSEGMRAEGTGDYVKYTLSCEFTVKAE